ncbi:carbonic anhydrase 3-like [Musca autumnalis]|uniref:carbonic anhydrase 3-like n=1 Tax=Musca autumnalis TaxID=221902 RepID=UPI003CE6CC17
MERAFLFVSNTGEVNEDTTDPIPENGIESILPGQDEAYRKKFPQIVYENYNNPSNFTITNNGQSAEFKINDDCARPQISGGPLPKGTTYQFESGHFHWGSDDSLGSEHVIDGQRYSLELHLVHSNTNYNDLEEALNHRDGVAVLTIFYQANPVQNLNGLQDVSDALSRIREYDSSTEITNFQLSGLFGSKRNFYYSYLGSLTTPPCSEAVNFIIFPTPVDVNPRQLEPFRLLLDANGDQLLYCIRVFSIKKSITKELEVFNMNWVPP